MTVKVIDASAFAALVFGEPDAETVLQAVGSDRLAAPTLMEYELANVCWKILRRRPEQRQVILATYAARHLFELAEHPVNADEVVPLAEATGLTAYDASYLWLSRHLRAPLVSLDRQLIQAAAA